MLWWDSHTIALFIRYFNAALTAITALFAIYGLVVAFGRNTRLNVFRGRMFLSAFCAASLLALAAEATVFNFPYYLRYFSGPQTELLGVFDEASQQYFISTNDDSHAEFIQNGIRFKNLNRKVTSVFVNVDFGNIQKTDMSVKWVDEASTLQYTKQIYKYLPHENYALLQSNGKVSELSVTFGHTSLINIENVVINKPIPFYFSGLRLLVVSLLFFAVILFAYKPLRAKTAYYLFEYTFDPKNKKQNIAYACTVALLILYSWVCVCTSVHNGDAADRDPWNQQYNKFLVDALIEGRTYLKHLEHPEKLLNAERPYDRVWLEENGYRNGVDWMIDWVWYKGKNYCYFGVVPAAILYVPYKMITGNYLSIRAGLFLFCAISVILIALLWRYCVITYMRDTRYAFYLLSFMTLFFASGLHAHLRHILVYSLVQCAGFMFTVAGILLLLKSVDNEKVNHLKLFFACLCLALVFGCRPNMGLASLLVPVVLWKYRTWKLPLFVMLPYIIVAIPLCVYNYVRFGSIFEFGHTYVITAFSLVGYRLQNPIGTFIRTFVCFIYYLFLPVALSLRFPFVETKDYSDIILGVMFFRERGFAIINFPIVFCLFYLFKNIFNKNMLKLFCLLYSSLIIAVIITVIDSLVVGYAGRYALDTASFIILPSLFCAYYWVNDKTSVLSPQTKTRLKITYALCVVTILIGLFLFVNGTSYRYFDPTLYRYLEYSLGVIRDV